MTKSFRKNVCLAAGLLIAGLSFPLSAEVIYDNSVNDLTQRFSPGTSEVADQIVLSSPGYITNFSFEFFAVNGAQATLQGSVEGRVQFYRMDGAPYNGYTTPGASFYDSGWFSIGGVTERSTLNFTAGSDFAPNGIYVPSTDMAWSIQFRGLGGNDVVGLDMFSPPVVGQNYPDYWLNTLTGWQLMQDSSGLPINFAARFEANIPEPTSATLLLLGIGSYLVVRRRR